MSYSRWQRLNPANSLFGRIFLWFWISAIIIVITTLLASRHLSEQLRYSQADAGQIKLLQETGARLNSLFHRGSGEVLPLPALLRRLGTRGQTDLLLLSVSEQRFISSFPLPRRFELKPFLLLSEQQGMLQLDSLHWQFTGPLPLTLNDQNFLLFAGKMQPPDLLMRIREMPYVLIAILLCLSGALCFGFAWSISRPIGKLIQATRAMAGGDLASRVDYAAQRRDEVGELGREFNDMAARLQAMVESQKRILADISHELRSPLARLQVAIGIAYQREQQPIPELKRIEKEANRIDTMLGQILALAKMDAAQQVIELQAMQLETVLDPLCEDISFEAKEKGTHFTCDFPRGLVIEADHRLLHSALENVLRNALRYARSEVSLQCNQAHGILSLTVIDDGPGLAEKDLRAVFRPFYRASAARNRETGGTGLGLAIASAAMAAHKGDIGAENRVPSGLRVTLKLPLLIADRPPVS
ncbi:ATP-binding protein [Rheinheimera maricola]|uniref:histidine kinase n=1 Tax=Rheinheimera maricola TaxID=2793282 RepID=A0ABS7XCY9_9GAMM|nr:ATP-binding protein [Rheinheimera maricola]MBZ9613040.1 HAMP domain-containing protein [Rheinheimera maricola]